MQPPWFLANDSVQIPVHGNRKDLCASDGGKRKFIFHICLFVVLLLSPMYQVFAKSCETDRSAGYANLSDSLESRHSIQEWRALRRKLGRKDPIFSGADMHGPLLFAHRGGVLETAESTVRGFRYALEIAGADVLELDVQLTRDGRFVVWHGPGLDNVFIEGIDPDPEKRPPGRRRVYEFDWHELDGRAWVADPGAQDLSMVPHHVDRRLLLLSNFLRIFDSVPLNIEMKGSFKMALGGRNGISENVAAFRDILVNAKHRRTIIVASARQDILDAFRRIDADRFPTNLSPWEQIKLKFTRPPLEHRALETSYGKFMSSRAIIRKVRDLNGATYVFITRFGPIEALDRRPKDASIFEILDRGVDGIMTDRPQALRKIMHRWLEQKRSPDSESGHGTGKISTQ